MKRNAVPEICENCRHWRATVDDQSSDKFGECKRFPPQWVTIETELERVWPVTEYKDFCGEFAVRVDA